MTDYRDPKRFRSSYIPEHAAKERWGLLWPALVVLGLLLAGIVFAIR
jgi:hypothetical protein